MSFLAYKPGELVTYRAPIHLFEHQFAFLIGHRIQALACQGPYRLLQELIPQVLKEGSLQLLDLERILLKINIHSPYTLVFQMVDNKGQPVAWQVTKNEDGVLKGVQIVSYRHQIYYGAGEGTSLVAATPPAAAGESVSALTYALCRCLGRSSPDKDDIFRFCNGKQIQTFTYSDLLEVVDNTVRGFRQTL